VGRTVEELPLIWFAAQLSVVRKKRFFREPYKNLIEAIRGEGDTLELGEKKIKES